MEGDRIVQGRLSRPNDLIISGTATVKLTAATGLTPPLALADLNATNATLSNFRTLTATEVWTVDVTPTSNGTVTVGVPHGVTGGTWDSSVRNAAGSLSMTAELGAPKAIWADFTSPNADVWSDGPYDAGDPIDLTIIFSENVTVSGVPTVRLRTPSRTVPTYDAAYYSGSGSSVLVFRHTVPAGGYGSGLTTIESTSITLPSGASIVDTAGTAASLALPPLITRVEKPAPTGADALTGAVGDQHDWIALFSEPVTVSQTNGAEPAYLNIQIAKPDMTAYDVRATYVGGSGSRELTFRYTVRAEDEIATIGVNNRRLYVPEGSGVRSAAGIDTNTRFAENINSTIRREDTRFRIRFALTAGYAGGDVTVRFISSDPERMSVDPSSVTFTDNLVDPGNFRLRRPITFTLHPDADSEDNSVAVLYRFESILAHVDGASGTFFRIRILDDDRARTHPVDLELELGLASDSDNIAPAGSEIAVAANLKYTGGYVPFQIAAGGALRIAGDFEWQTNGRRSIAVDSQSTLELGAQANCKSAALDGLTTWTCALETDDSTIEIPPGAPDGVFAISGEVEIDGITYRGSLDVAIGDVDEVTSTVLNFATDIAPGDSTDTPTDNQSVDDRPYPSRIANGESTRLRLTILNENDAASAAGALESVLLTTTAGTLSLANPEGECQDGGRVCGVPVDLLNAKNSDRILIDLAHPGEAGTAVVRATVVAKDGENFRPEPLTVTLLGPAASLAISEPATALLNVGTPDSGAERDDRDLLTLSVTASDAAGNAVAVPAGGRSGVLRGPDGAPVDGVRIDWPLDARDPAGNPQARIDVNVEPSAALATSEYTLELRAGGITAAQRLIVAGPAAAITVSAPQGEIALGGSISVTARVADAEGNPVPNGTPVAWAARSTNQSAVLVRLAADAVTTDGAASATFLTVSTGSAIVSAESGDAREIALLSIAPGSTAGPAEQTASLRQSLGNQGAPGITAWLGDTRTSASSLLDALSGINSIRLWQASRWFRYTFAANGQAATGSVDFTINPGAILWLSP